MLAEMQPLGAINLKMLTATSGSCRAKGAWAFADIHNVCEGGRGKNKKLAHFVQQNVGYLREFYLFCNGSPCQTRSMATADASASACSCKGNGGSPRRVCIGTRHTPMPCAGQGGEEGRYIGKAFISACS